MDSVRERWRGCVRLCPNVVIRTSWMPFPVGIMNVKVVKGYGALDTAWTRWKRQQLEEGGREQRKEREHWEPEERTLWNSQQPLKWKSFFAVAFIAFC